MIFKSKKSFKSPIQPFTSAFQKSVPFRAWFTILSLPDQSSSGLTDFIISFLEYLQLIIQVIFLNQTVISNNPKTTPAILTTLVNACRTLNPGYIFNFNPNDRGFALTVFLGLFSFLILKYGLFLYVAVLAVKRSSGSRFILRAWKWIFRLQGRVIYLFVSTIWLSLLRAANLNQLGFEKDINAAIITGSNIGITLEFVFSFILLTYFSYSMPSKNFMTAKNQYIEALTLTQKFVVQIVKNVLLSATPSTLSLVRTFLALFFCFVRNLYYLMSFPHYRLKATLYQSSLLIIVTCLNVSYLIHTWLKNIYDSHLNQGFGLILSIVLTILLVSLCHRYINNVWLELLVGQTSNKQKLLIHQIMAIKNIIKFHKVHTREYERYSSPYLFSVTTTIKIQSFLLKKQGTTPEGGNDFGSKEDVNKFIKEHLQELLIKYPTNDLLKLYVSKYYATKLQLYGQPLKILQELKNSSNSNTALSACVVLYNIEAFVKTDYKSQNSKIDLYTYMKNVSVLAKLKEEIFTQAEAQAKLYEHLTRSPQDLGKIFDLAQKVNQCRGKIEKKIRSVLDKIPGYFLEPIMLSAHYSFVLNHAPHKYQFYTKIYNQRFRKYEKQLLSENMCQENLHHKYDHLLLISGNKKDLGKLKYVSKNLADKTYGKNVEDHHICSVLPGHIKENVYTNINMLFELGDKAFLDRVTNSFEYNFIGRFFVPCDYYCNVNPFLNQGLSYLMVVRLDTNPKEYIVIDDDGNITGSTQAVGLELGLFDFRKQLQTDKKINIDLISSDLARVNQAFNLVLSPDKRPSNTDSNLSFEEAKELHSTFSNRGEELKLRSLKLNGRNRDPQDHLTHTYHCMLEAKQLSTIFVRVIALKRVHGNDENIKDDTGSSISEKIDLRASEPPKEDEDLSNDSVASENIERSISNKEDDLQQSNILSTQRNNSSKIPMLRNKTNYARKIIQGNVDQSETEQDFLSTSRKLLTARNFGESIGLTRDISSPVSTFSRCEISSSKEGRKEGQAYGAVRQIDALSGHQSSQRGKRKDPTQVSKDFHNAIYSKFNPISVKVLTLLLYAVFSLILIFQILFKEMLNENVQILQARKSVASFCLNRTNSLVNVYTLTRTLWTFAVGVQNQSDYPMTSQAPFLMPIAKKSLEQLGQINEDMMIAINSLDSYGQEKLFEKNVRIFDTPLDETDQSSFINMTTFQAIGKIIETDLRGLMLGKANLQAVIPDFDIVLINAMNDPLVHSEILASFLISSSTQQKEVVIARNISNLVVNIALLSFIFIVFCIAVYKQSQKEKQNMLAVGKINIHEVRRIMDNVIDFQTMLQDETRFDQLPIIDTFNSSKENIAKSRNLTMSTQRVIYTNIIRKYQRYPLAFAALLLILTGLVIVMFFRTDTSIKNIALIFRQMYFIGKVKTRVGLASVMTLDLLSESEGTILIRNQPVLTQFYQEQEYLQNVTYSLTDILKREDSTYDPVVEGILFGNACKYISGLTGNLCYTKSRNSINTGLVRFMTDYQSILANFEAAYDRSNKTEEALASLGFATYNDRVPAILIINALLNVISDQLEQDFSKTITETQAASNLRSGLMYIFSVIICFLLHVTVINRVKEAENNFRNVLKVFPAKLVLSNFMLKSYLMRTWKGVFDYSKMLGAD